MGTRLLLSAAAAVVEGRKLKQEDLGERVVFRNVKKSYQGLT